MVKLCTIKLREHVMLVIFMYCLMFWVEDLAIFEPDFSPIEI